MDMWGSGLGHGFLMGVGWLLSVLVLGAVIYVAVRLAFRGALARTEQLIEEVIRNRMEGKGR